MNDDVLSFFRDHMNQFTIYVVEQRFVTGKGCDYFRSFRGKPNYIDSDQMVKSFLVKVHQWIDKKIPVIAELIKIGFDSTSAAGILDIVVALTKLFSTQEHQAAGPNVIDPIIIQEGKVVKKYINQLVNLYKHSPLAPAIIILLKDNDFDRAKSILSESPNGTYIKFIRNSGQTQLYRVVNTGVENVEDFIVSFSQQCFSTCSNTKRDILLNKDWIGDSIVRAYAPSLLRYRANLLCDEKNEILSDLSQIINKLENSLRNDNTITDHDRILLQNFLCVAKIYRIFCMDNGEKDMKDVMSLSAELNNEILMACVYKYAFFMSDLDVDEQNKLLQEAQDIFIKNGMYDNALYCRNNELVRQFDVGSIHASDFADMIGDATGNVPGLVGMPHLYNNAGMAYMMTAQLDLAMEYFDKGLEYSKNPDRYVQKMALECNKLISRSYYCEHIEQTEINRLLIQIFDGMVDNGRLPFISSRYIMNLLIIAFRCNPVWVSDLMADYKIIDALNQGLQNNALGSGQLLMQIDYLDQKLPGLKIKDQCITPKQIVQVSGKRKAFIEKSGLNPFYFCTWL